MNTISSSTWLAVAASVMLFGNENASAQSGVIYTESYVSASFPSVLNPLNMLLVNQDDTVTGVIHFPTVGNVNYFRFGGINYT